MKDKTMKAQDVFANTHNPFGEKSTFERSFPGIDSIKVHVTEINEYGEESNRYYETDSLGQFINCSREKCYKGGFDIGSEIGRLHYMRS